MTCDEADTDARLNAVLTLLRTNGVTDTDGGWSLTQLAGGWSRHTHLLRELTGPRRYIVRVRTPGSLLETDLLQEYRVYAAAAENGVPVPRVHGVDPAPVTALGGPFFVMDHVEGHSPLVWRGRDRAELESNWAASRSIATEVVACLAAIHAVPVEGTLDFLAPSLSFEQVVQRWRAIHDKNYLVDDPVVDEAYEWVLSRVPDPVAPCLVHGDFRIGNMLLHDQRLAAVIDWELAYLGDPCYDIGYAAMPYYAGKFVQPGSALVGAFAEQGWLIAEYERLRGVPVDREAVRTYTVLGTLQLIAILTTGLRKFTENATGDPRMAWNRFVLPGLRQDMVRLMGW